MHLYADMMLLAACWSSCCGDYRRTDCSICSRQKGKVQVFDSALLLPGTASSITSTASCARTHQFVQKKAVFQMQTKVIISSICAIGSCVFEFSIRQHVWVKKYYRQSHFTLSKVFFFCFSVMQNSKNFLLVWHRAKAIPFSCVIG